MKKAILIYALSRNPWIGGIYYKKNIAHMLAINKKICNKFDIVILTNERYKKVFETLEPCVILEICSDHTGFFGAIVKSLICCFKYQIKYIFPVKPFYFFNLINVIPVSWIADFQHNHYPSFFSNKEIIKRNKDFSFIAHNTNPLVLSSWDALNDFNKFYNKNRENVHVVHFSSYIQDELKQLNNENEYKILKNYDLSNKNYVMVCNQFWKHKNHKVVFKAIRNIFSNNTSPNIMFVFTGELNDWRNPEYCHELMTILNDGCIKEHVRILGFINRVDQICLMKHAEILIQPSLFEGWGTVVEDGKILGKKMILSDIPVHREQRNKNCELFKPNDDIELAKLILKIHVGNVYYGSGQDLSFQYSRALEDVFQ